MPDFRCSRCNAPLGTSGLLCDACVGGVIMSRVYTSMRSSGAPGAQLQGGGYFAIGAESVHALNKIRRVFEGKVPE